MSAEVWTKVIIRGIICLSGIIGNSWLCISSLPKSFSQLRPNDALFVNLAVSNLITNCLVDPLHITNSKSFLPVVKVVCGFVFFLPEFSQTSSIFSTMFITVYWHQKLVGSLKRGGAPVKMDNIRFIAALLAGSWTVALVLNIPHFFAVVEVVENVTLPECQESLTSQEAEQAYKVVHTILTSVLPLIWIFYASVHIAITLLRNEMRMKSTAVNSGENASAEKSADDTTSAPAVTKSKPQAKSNLLRAAKSVVAVAFFFLTCWIFHLIVNLTGSFAPSKLLDDLNSYIGASYTCIIPFIYLHGMQRLTCSK